MQLVVWILLSAFGAGGIAMHIANRNVERDERNRRWTKYCAYFVIVSAVLFAAQSGPIVFVPLLSLVAVLGARELWRAQRSSCATRVPFGPSIWVAYTLACAGLLSFALWSTPHEAVFTYLCVAFFDGFSQIIGQLVGKHPLVRRLSPGKTWEGMVGGLVTAVACGIALRHLVERDAARGALLAFALALAALGGDLAASWVKRRCGLKDFGTWLPAHGGVLDRFDSLFGAAPVSLLLLHFVR
jgi:phosphatidate cytidylyltransferase